MAIPSPILERGGCLYLRLSEPPRLWIGLLFLLPLGYAVLDVAQDGWRVDPVAAAFGAVIALCLVGALFAYRGQPRSMTKLDLAARTLDLPARFPEPRHVAFDQIAEIALVQGHRMNPRGFTIPWHALRLTARDGGRPLYVFDCDWEKPVEIAAERVAGAMGLPLQRVKSDGLIP